MTTHFRTLLLLVFTGLAASLAGCIVETRDSDRDTCRDNQYFQVYWSVDDAVGPLGCRPPAFDAHVELVTNTGVTYPVGKECAATPYMGFVFDFRGSTNNVPAGTYVVTANLVSDTTQAVLSTTGPVGTSQYAIPACNSVILAYPFML